MVTLFFEKCTGQDPLNAIFVLDVSSRCSTLVFLLTLRAFLLGVFHRDDELFNPF
jgi:hypothetical protein